ncbi:cytochrome c [Pedobacter sp. UYEF25]
MKKTILTLGAAIILMGSYCTSSKTGEQSADTSSMAKVDNVVTAAPATNEPAKADTQKVTLPKVEPKETEKPVIKLPPPVVAKDNSAIAGTPAQIAAGGKLLAKSDCLACHNEQTKIVGPAYVMVAEKYKPNEANINYLVGKVINGGSGVWGAIPMSPHPTLAKADVKLMVQYILALKK